MGEIGVDGGSVPGVEGAGTSISGPGAGVSGGVGLGWPGIGGAGGSGVLGGVEGSGVPGLAGSCIGFSLSGQRLAAEGVADDLCSRAALL